MLFRRCFICLFFTLSSLYVHTYQPELDWNNVHSRVYVKRKKTKRAVKKNPEDLLASNKNNQVPSNIVLHDKRLQTNIKTLETANVLPTVNDKQPEEPSSSDMEDSPKANSYSLGDLLVIALKCNPLCKQAWAAYKASYETYRQNQSVYYPSISLTGSVERTRTKTGSTYKQGNNYKAGLDLSYLLYDFGKRESEVKRKQINSILF